MSGVKTTNKFYTNMTSRWQQNRDCYEGQKAIHDAKETYLPRIGKEEDDEDDVFYDGYRTRTRFFNAFRRTVDNMVGIVFRKEPEMEDEDEMFDNVTGDGESMEKYSHDLLEELLKVGRAGTLVDYPVIEDGLTVAETERLNAAPTLVGYTAEQIINWKYSTVNNLRILTMVVLKEEYSDTVDEFSHEMKERYRVLDLLDGKYRQRIFKEGVSGGDIFPIMNDKNVDSIPFIIHGDDDIPPLQDLSDMNIKHYQLKADHTHGLRYVALPTPVVTGVSKEDAPTTIGPQKAWVLESPDANAFMLEFTGQGLASIENEIKDVKDDMVNVGARMLEAEGFIAKTATEAVIDNSNKNSSLMNIVRDANSDLKKIVDIMVDWSDGDEDTKYELSTDFIPAGLDPQKIVSLVKSWQDNAITQETLFDNLKKGEVIGADENFEDYKAILDLEIPPEVDEFGAPRPTDDEGNVNDLTDLEKAEKAKQDKKDADAIAAKTK